MDVFLVYGLLLVFFLALIPVLWLILKEEGPETHKKTAHERQRQTTKIKLTGDQAASYGLLGIVLTFLLVLTVIRHKRS